METANLIRAQLLRLARLDAAETWNADLNPAQIAALDYLARANRFSRAPSHVAAYLGTTRGTTSQTLKALVRKGYVRETRSHADKRSITCDLTEAGRQMAVRGGALLAAISAAPAGDQAVLQTGLSAVLARVLSTHEGRGFGLCADCAHHQRRNDGSYCVLLSVPLAPTEAEQICHEQVAA